MNMTIFEKARTYNGAKREQLCVKQSVINQAQNQYKNNHNNDLTTTTRFTNKRSSPPQIIQFKD